MHLASLKPGKERDRERRGGRGGRRERETKKERERERKKTGLEETFYGIIAFQKDTAMC